MKLRHKVWAKLTTYNCKGCNRPNPHDGHLTRFGNWVYGSEPIRGR
jgi:hypothetical protein